MHRAVSLFAGAGGFCEGVRLAGFKVICAVESDSYACETHAANFKNVALFDGDIRRFLRDERKGVPSKSKLIERGIDLVYGGPPCQGFSIIGPRDHDDPRNDLYREFVRVVRELKPSIFIMENVPNMVAMKSGHFKSKILSAFRRVGYKRTAILPLISSDFGVPQHRRRVFIFGLRDDLPCNADLQQKLSKLIAKEIVPRSVTVAEAISDLPSKVSAENKPLKYPDKPKKPLSAYQKLMRLDCSTPILSSDRKRAVIEEDKLYNHHTKGMEARRKKIVRKIQPGGTGAELSKRLWKGIRGHKWRRLDPMQPSYTILAQMHRDMSEWIHPKHQRWITVREFVIVGIDDTHLRGINRSSGGAQPAGRRIQRMMFGAKHRCNGRQLCHPIRLGETYMRQAPQAFLQYRLGHRRGAVGNQSQAGKIVIVKMGELQQHREHCRYERRDRDFLARNRR
jgi:DNA (cytosine-5)-methyltransferase 1